MITERVSKVLRIPYELLERPDVLDVAEKLCNKVAIIKDGHLITSGRMSEVMKDQTSLEALFMETVNE